MSRTVAVIMDDGATFYTSDTTPETVDMSIQSGESLRCWWFSPNGQRHIEDFRFMSDRVHYVRTESDDQ